MTYTRNNPSKSDPIVKQDLEALFQPRSIAVVGASANERSSGYSYVRGLLKMEFPGQIYPVNPKFDEILGLKSYPRLDAIPGSVDFVISAVPASATLKLVEEAKAKNVKLIHFFTARFSETGRRDGVEAERALSKRSKEAGVRVIGPNCMGLYYPKAKITFNPNLPPEPGNVGFLSQSGGHAFGLISRGGDRGLRFSKVISYGNALDLNEADFLEHFANDPDTDVIAAYIEGVRNGRRFYEALRRATERKPVVVFKGGRTSAGRTAVASHTASLATSDTIWRAVVKQAGAIEVYSLNELIDMLVAFRNAGPAKGRRVVVLNGAGGGTVEAADLCHEADLELAPIPQNVREVLREKVPHAWDWISNPVDISILTGESFGPLEIIEMMATSPSNDAIIANVGVEFNVTEPEGEKRFRSMLDRIKKLAIESNKAVALVMSEPVAPEDWRWKAFLMARRELTAAGAAIYPNIERAIQVMSRYLGHSTKLQA